MFVRSLARRFKKLSSTSTLKTSYCCGCFYSNLATLRVHGPDCKGIVATCSNILDQRGYEIVATEHWTDRIENLLFLRIAFDKETKKSSESSSSKSIEHRVTDIIAGISTTSLTSKSSSQHPPSNLEQRCSNTEIDLQRFCEQRRLSWALNWRLKRPRVAIMVSKYDHCLWELLLRRREAAAAAASASQDKEEELLADCDMVAVVSNHENLRPVAEAFDIPFHFFPITSTLDKNNSNKDSQERQQVQLLKDQLDVDIVVLARYMQVLSPTFLHAFPQAIINIHHSFLPAFSGRRPYHAAFERGVKLIGATAHYTTAELDQGPIIEQVSVSFCLGCVRWDVGTVLHLLTMA
jgi:formyltetrahydrofolate deformylase